MNDIDWSDLEAVYGAIDAVDAITDDKEKKKVLRAIITRSQEGTIGPGPGEWALEKLNSIISTAAKSWPKIIDIGKAEPEPVTNDFKEIPKMGWWRKVKSWFRW